MILCLPKDLLQLVFLELDHGHDMINFSEINRKSHRIFQQQIEIKHDNTSIYMLNKQGRRHGICRGYNFNGEELWYENNYFHGRRHGLNRGWWANYSLPRYRDQYLHGKLHGIQYSWDENGFPYQEENYIYGHLQIEI